MPSNATRLPACIARQVVPGAFIPFGAGSRACVGMRFAELTALLTLIRLYQQVGRQGRGAEPCHALEPPSALGGSSGGAGCWPPSTLSIFQA